VSRRPEDQEVREALAKLDDKRRRALAERVVGIYDSGPEGRAFVEDLLTRHEAQTPETRS